MEVLVLAAVFAPPLPEDGEHPLLEGGCAVHVLCEQGEVVPVVLSQAAPVQAPQEGRGSARRGTCHRTCRRLLCRGHA